MSQQLRSAETLKEKATREKERLERLVARCGEAVHLVPDNLLVAGDIRFHHPSGLQAHIIRQELKASVEWLSDEPIMTALQSGRAAVAAVQCRHCQPSAPLTVRYKNLSGSSVEGLHDLFVNQGGTSDHDIMFEYGGPFRWAAIEEPGCISPEAAPQLYAEPSSSPGFVILFWARTSRCSHEAPLPALPADSIRRLMWYYVRMRAPTDADITCSGPAINVLRSDDKTGGKDHVPCLRLPWWPEGEAFLCRHRVTDFPPAATRRDLCRFGVHLVPTGRPGSENEQFEYRVSFSRAEVIAIRHLNPVQHATITSTKEMKNTLKNSGATPALKSYHIKTAVLWLAQDQPSDRWTGVTAGVHMVLDWLEHRLSAGSIPCFFWPAINLLAGRGTAELEDIANTVQLMRTETKTLLMSCCARMYPHLDTMLEGGPEPLSERQLRIRLAQQLIHCAVYMGVLHRSTAPYFEDWFRCFIPVLSRLSQHRLLQWLYRRQSGIRDQGCCLLQALAVAPADLVAGMRLTSLGGGMFSWPVTPLLDMLTESDVERMLGDPAVVATWCRQQLCRPAAERPAGLTAELDTPRGRAELLLQPELYLLALSEVVPAGKAWWQREDQKSAVIFGASLLPLRTYQQCRERLEDDFSINLEYNIRHFLPELDDPTVAVTANIWRWHLQLLLSGDRLREAYTAVTTQWPDRWQLCQYLLLDNTALGKTRREARPTST